MWIRSGNRRPESDADRCPENGKIIYPTNKAAAHAVIGFKRRKGSHFKQRGERALQVFPCGDHFHIGHARDKQNSRNQRRYGR